MTEEEIRRIVREEIEAERQDQSAINKASINTVVRSVVVSAITRESGLLFGSRPRPQGGDDLTPEVSPQ